MKFYKNSALKFFGLAIIAVLFMQFNYPEKAYYFQDIPVEYSGLNHIDSVKINVLYSVGLNVDKSPTIEYPYSNTSSGVGVGDFNNDGKTDIFFSSNVSNNQLFINKGSFKFEDVSESAGIKGNGTWGVGVSIVDINADGKLDIFVSHSGNFSDSTKLQNELFINEGSVNGIPHFVERAKSYGLNLPGNQTTQTVFFDYDRDGDLDAFVLNHAIQPFQVFHPANFYRQNINYHHANILLRNDNGHFVNVTESSKIVGSNLSLGLGVIVSDFNNDGWPDIYATSDFSERDFFYINQKDGTFKEQSDQSFNHLPSASMGVDAADYNNDGLVDILNAEMKPQSNYRQKLTSSSDNEDDFNRTVNAGFGVQYGRNMLQLHQGNDKNGIPHFSEVGQATGVFATDWSWSPLFADFDNDGWKDIFISAGYPDDLSLDTRNNYINSSFDPESKKDHYLKTNSHFFKNDQKDGFKEVTEKWKPKNLKMSYASAYADFDNDGAIDLVISNLNDVPTLLRNIHNTNNGHYLTVALKEKGKNRFAIGAKLIVESSALKQVQELQPIRGYASSQDYNLHIGLGSENFVDLTVVWPDGKITNRKHVSANQFLTIEKDEKELVPENIRKESTYLFNEISFTNCDSFISKQNEHPDFKYQFSLPYKVSDFGQIVAEGDINNDGHVDYYIGGESGKDKFFMMGNSVGKFDKYKPSCFQVTDDNSSAVLLDIDKDGDLDLIVESRKGRTKQPQVYYSDTVFICRVYENLGKGNYKELLDAMPNITTVSKVLIAGDFDNDGLTDLFVGGYCSPLNFGKATKSYILKNDSKSGKIHFTDITNSLISNDNLGMVTSGEWIDLDKDKYPELILSTEWGSCKIFKNKYGKNLSDITTISGLNRFMGLWSFIKAIDVNNDGNLDLVVGNIGNNNQFIGDFKHPMKLRMIDFENNSSSKNSIPIVSVFEKEIEYPIYYRDEMLASVQNLRTLYPNFESYANANIQEIITKVNAKIDTVLECNSFLSGVFMNNGKGKYFFNAFPNIAQTTRLNAVNVYLDKASKQKNLLIAGNFFGYKVQFGRQDGLSIGLLKNNGQGQFEAQQAKSTGLFSNGQVSRIFNSEYKNKNRIIIFRKNEAPQLFEANY